MDKKTGEHLPFINVLLKGTTIGTTTDNSGHYFLKNLPEGKFTLEYKALGYKTVSKEVSQKKGKTLEINVELEEDQIALDGVVVSANRAETSRRLAPTLVNVLDAKVFTTTNAVNLAQGLNFQPGVRVETNCQNCGFQQVRINGLDGPYTQILIDSRPIFSALSGVYGLEQIPANMIERVEVMRGGGSALFGSSAIAGTINIITKEPLRNSGELSHTLTSIGGTSAFDNNTTLNASLLSENGKAGLYLFGQNRQVRSLAVSVRILVRPVITIPVCILGRSENTPFMFVILGEKIEFQTSSINRMLQLFGDIRFMRRTIQQISSPAVFIHMMILECQFTISTHFQVRTETNRLILQFRQLRKTISILIKTGTMTVLAKKICL